MPAMSLPAIGPICTAFHISRASPEGISYGDRTDHRKSRISDLSIFDPSQEDSKKAALWNPHLDDLRDRGWRMAYTDGSGEDRTKAAGVSSEGVCGSRRREYGGFLGPLASVADAERLAITLALEEERGLVAIASDSQAALRTLFNLADGGTPRSHIEKRMKDALASANQDREIGALWVRGHIGIGGNERADRRAALEGIRGRTNGAPHTITPEGLKEVRKAIRATARTVPSYGRGRTEWGKHALAAFTWTRTDRGPQKAWLHHIGKAEDPSCTCGHTAQDGAHLVFHCPDTSSQRRRLLPPGATTWESLDEPHWVTEAGRERGEQEKVEGIEAFFQELYWKLRRRDEGGEEVGEA